MQKLTDLEYFEEAFSDLMKWEGCKYTNDPDDPGGETKFGISKKSFPNSDIKNLTVEDAQKIYYERYWKPIKCIYIIDATNSLELGKKVFNIAVNVGNVTALKLLQRAMCAAFKPSEACNVNEDIFTYIKPDGIIGPITQKILRFVNPEVLIATFKSEVANYYKTLINNNPHLKKYQVGWLRRAYA